MAPFGVLGEGRITLGLRWGNPLFTYARVIHRPVSEGGDKLGRGGWSRTVHSQSHIIKRFTHSQHEDWHGDEAILII